MSSPAVYQRHRFSTSVLRSEHQVTSGMPSKSKHQQHDDNLAYGTSLNPSAIQCEACVSECRQPSCPAAVAQITDQCTDKCVVINCHDLTHDQVPCPGTGLDQACDFVCDCVVDCKDCIKYEELLQCCTDYHSYSSQHPHFMHIANTSASRGLGLDTLLCDCQDPSISTVDNDVLGALSDTSQSKDEMLLPSSNSIAMYNPHTPEIRPPSSNSFPFYLPAESNQTPVASQNVDLLSCMWGNCHQTFPTFPELVVHVNDTHLPSSVVNPFISTEDPLQLQTQQHDSTTFDFSCHWADCEQCPSSNSIPGPSTGNQCDALETLASHLFRDHLGFLTEYKTLPEPTEEIIPDGIPTPPASPLPPSGQIPADDMQQDCLDSHVCCWESCAAAFASCDQLTAHITALHVGAGKAHYDCLWKDCNRHGERGFSSKQKICRHLQSHTGHRPFQCERCRQYFSEAATLQQHMRRHTQEKPYTCDFPGCGKAFAIMGALTIHTRKHNGLKPFKCKYCERAFAESSNLSKHLRTHTGDRPYSCAVADCGKSFARPDQLTRHMGVHKKKSHSAKHESA